MTSCITAGYVLTTKNNVSVLNRQSEENKIVQIGVMLIISSMNKPQKYFHIIIPGQLNFHYLC